jgi:hypothetical protein
MKSKFYRRTLNVQDIEEIVHYILLPLILIIVIIGFSANDKDNYAG